MKTDVETSKMLNADGSVSVSLKLTVTGTFDSNDDATDQIVQKLYNLAEELGAGGI